MKFTRPRFVAMVALLALCSRGGFAAWKDSPGVTLRFQNVDPAADIDSVVKIAQQHLESVHAVVTREGADRIAVWIPYSPAHQKAHDDFASAREALVRVSPGAEDLGNMEWLPPAQRDAAWDGIAPRDSPERARLDALGDAANASARAAAREHAFKPAEIPTEVLTAAVQAQDAYRLAWEAALKDYASAGSILIRIEDALEPDGAKSDAALRDIVTHHPLQAAAIQATRVAAQRLRDAASDEPEPEQIEELLGPRGKLDFRIVVVPGDFPDGQTGDAYQVAVRNLENSGPGRGITVDTSAGPVKARWFVIAESGQENFRFGLVTAQHAGVSYVLCYDDSALNNPTPHTLTHADPGRQSWTVAAKMPKVDSSSGVIMLPFNLDPVGAKYMGELTDANMHHPMALLIDDMAINAPTINGHITDSAVISAGGSASGRGGGSATKEARHWKLLMDAAALPPLTLKRVP